MSDPIESPTRPAAQQPLSRGNIPPEVVAPARALAEELGAESASQAIVTGWNALRRAFASRPDLVHPGVGDYVASAVIHGALPTLVVRVRAAALRDAAEQLLATDVHEDLCSYGPPGTCDCALGEHYRWLVKLAEQPVAPSVRPDTDRTPDVGTPDPQRYWWQHDDCDSAPIPGAADWPSGPCTGCGMSLGGWTRGAPIAEEAP